jgi:TonB family protein
MSNVSGSETISRADLLGLSTQPNEPLAFSRRSSFGVRAWRRSSAVAISVTLHLAAAVVVLYAVHMAAPSAVPQPQRNFTFMEVSHALPVEPAVHIPPLSVPRLTAETVTRATALPTPRLDEPPPPVIENHRIEPSQPAAELSTPELPSKPQPGKPAAPIVVGAFPTVAASAIAPNAGGQVHPTGFDAPSAKAPDLKLPTTAVGAFERAAASDVPRPGTDRSTGSAVADAGFGALAPAPAPSAVPRTVGEAGFGSAASDGRSRASEPKHVGEVQRSGFDDAHTPPPVSRPSPAPARVDVPLEILSKPSPAYTDDARALKLEGEVLLEVEFAASGAVRVLRVVRGLGHGLDETAARAAEAIRFKPAQAGGHPVDFRTTVHIVFRLT